MSKLKLTEVFTGGDGVVILSVTGDLDLATCGQLETRLRTLQMGDRPDIVLDLSEVGFIDSTGLGVLIACHRRARLGGSLLIRGSSAQALQLFRLTGLDYELNIEPRLSTSRPGA